MVRELVKANCNVHFDQRALKRWNIPRREIQPSKVERVASEDTAYEKEEEVGEEVTPQQHHAIFEEHRSPLYKKAEADVRALESSGCCSKCGRRRGDAAAQGQGQALTIEKSFDDKDALKKKGDRLKKSRVWWILEIFPTYYEWQDESGQWVGKWRSVMTLFFFSLSLFPWQFAEEMLLMMSNPHLRQLSSGPRTRTASQPVVPRKRPDAHGRQVCALFSKSKVQKGQRGIRRVTRCDAGAVRAAESSGREYQRKDTTPRRVLVRPSGRATPLYIYTFLLCTGGAHIPDL